MGTNARKYLSRVDEGGRIVILRSDGEPFTASDKSWFDEVITRALRQSATFETDGGTGSEASDNGDHPTMLRLRAILSKQTFSYASLSVMMGKRKTALSEWLRGTSKPLYHEVYRLFSMLGYRLHPIPTEIEADVIDLVALAERLRTAKLAELNMGDDDSVGNVRPTQGDA